jgi:hypothetical protein
VQREANAVADIYRDSQNLADPARGQVQGQIKDYLKQVLNTEWPLMLVGKQIPDQGDVILGKMVKELGAAVASPAVTDMLAVSRNIYDARQQRIQMSYTSLSPEIWVVILMGSLLTLCISYLFGINLYLHFFVVIAATLMTSSIIFLLISLDKPFQGQYIVGPDIFHGVLAFIEKA